MCRGCQHPSHPTVCRRCGERLPSGIAWEDVRAGPLPLRFLKTLRDIALRPKVAFPGPARPLPSLAFATVCGLGLGTILVTMAAVLLLAGSPLLASRLDESLPIFVAAMGLALFLPVALVLAWALVQAASFTLGLISVGRGRGAFRFALRSCGYAQAIVLLAVLVPFLFASAAHLLDGVASLMKATQVSWIIASALWPVLTARVCFWAGRGMGLSSARAAFAAFGPSLVCTPAAAWVGHQQLEMLREPAVTVFP
jgi:hypothetical protein